MDEPPAYNDAALPVYDNRYENQRRDRVHVSVYQDKAGPKPFEGLLKVFSSDPVDFVCTPELSQIVQLYILGKHSNDCHFEFGKSKLISPGDTLNNRMAAVKIAKQYETCMKNKKLLCIPLTLQLSEKHRNMLIINPFLHRMELFEPHGTPRMNILGFFMDKVEDAIQKRCDPLMKIDTEFSASACPYSKGIGIQAYDGTPRQKKQYVIMRNFLVNDPGGFCCVWSWLVMDYRLTYPEKTIGEFAALLRRQFSEDYKDLWREFIRGYTVVVTQTLHDTLQRVLPDKFKNKSLYIITLSPESTKYFKEALEQCKAEYMSKI